MDLARLLRDAGVTVVEVDDWRTRGRDGFDPAGILVHHTAGPPTGTHPSLRVCIDGRPDTPGPLCHLLIGRNGHVWVIAAGRAAHAGRGNRRALDEITSGRGVAGDAGPLGRRDDTRDGNRRLYGIEVEHTGRPDEPWDDTVVDVLVRVCAAICRAHSWTADHVAHHREYTARKPDMAWRGPLRDRIRAELGAATAPPHVAAPTEEDHTMLVVQPGRDPQTRGYPPGRLAYVTLDRAGHQVVCWNGASLRGDQPSWGVRVLRLDGDGGRPRSAFPLRALAAWGDTPEATIATRGVVVVADDGGAFRLEWS